MNMFKLSEEGLEGYSHSELRRKGGMEWVFSQWCMKRLLLRWYFYSEEGPVTLTSLITHSLQIDAYFVFHVTLWILWWVKERREQTGFGSEADIHSLDVYWLTPRCNGQVNRSGQACFNLFHPCKVVNPLIYPVILSPSNKRESPCT